MQIESLKIFCDVVRFGSFSRCATENGVSQSAASQTVQNLEDHLGVPLIDRSVRPWTPTAEGRIFYEGSRDLLDRYAALEGRLKGRLPGDPEVRVACIYSVGLRHMKYYAQKFTQLHPGTEVRIDYLHPDRVVESVLDDRADIGIVSFPRPTRDLVVIPWKEEPMVVACPPDHPLAHLKEIAVGKLAGQKVVSFDRGLVIRAEIDRFLKRAGVDVDVTLEFDNIESIKRAVEFGSGVALLPRPTMDREVVEGTLKAVTLSGEVFYRPLGIIYRRSKTFGQNLTRFVDLLQSEKKTEFLEVAPSLEKARTGAR